MLRQVYLSSTGQGAQPTLLKDLSESTQLAWIPDTDQLAFISQVSGVAQVLTYDRSSGAVLQRTRSKDPIVQFRFAPNGQALAYATRAIIPPAASLYSRFHESDTGILVDSDITSSHDFLYPKWYTMLASAPMFLWVQMHNENAALMTIPGDVSDFFWSSMSDALSVNYVGDDSPIAAARSYRRSLGILNLNSGSFRVVAKSSPPLNGRPGQNFYGGEWVPNKGKILIRRVTETDLWVSPNFPEWCVEDVASPVRDASLSWHPAETNGVDGIDGMAFIPIDDSTIMVTEVIKGVQSLYVWDSNGTKRSKLLASVDGSSSLFAFSADRSRMAFVNESLTRPQEIYLKIGANDAIQKLSNLNSEIAAKMKVTSVSREVTWASTDGTTVSGWLVEPADLSHKGPWPLVTMVHGGPGYAFPNAFAPYFYAYGGIWPYPFDVFAAHGIAVFFPNYRGTATYGRAFQSPTKSDGEPVEDVVTGVRYLIHAGIADPARLGITGQSHGAWLGSVVMTRDKIFRASSFAEGTANAVVMYEVMDGQLNREVHDVEEGGSLYDSPQRYLDLSPDLHFKGIWTANMFEGGAFSSALDMLGFDKASRRLGLPTEMIVYPKTFHNVQIPRLQRESAERNLDWFRFWLKSEEDPDPSKAEQYKRWRELRDLQLKSQHMNQ
jgi:dipeptidyl aminopeptidase/acylaminoacyl peptidase